ncbi:MAG: hypothetical protein AAF791_14925 [Bacteroidota bacterium]
MPFSNAIRRRVLRAASALLPFFPGVAFAQTAPAETVRGASEALRVDQSAHLWRVGAWGAANVAGGLALVALSDTEADRVQRAFGIQSAAWGAINVGIAAVGLARGPGDATDDWAEAHAAENGYADILLVNLGLNVGYAGVGTAMVVASGQGVTRADDWRGHGLALILQGAGLFILDGIAYLGSRARLGGLVDLAERTRLSASTEGVRLGGWL